MTAPGSSISAPGYYHASSYGMFSPATYTGAGFPQSFPRHFSIGDTQPYPHHQPQPPPSGGGPPGSSGGRLSPSHPPGSANSAAAAASAALDRDRIYGSAYSGGLPDEPSSTHRAAIPSSSSTDNIFAHQPPPLSAGAGPPPPFGHQPHQAPYQPQYRPPSGVALPADYTGRRPEDNRDDYSRPGTSDTARPDTAYSTFSTNSGYSAAAALYQHLTHPSLYHTAGSNGGPPGFDRGFGAHHPHLPQHHHTTYNFIPLPSHPKKRPRRRFEEIERLYNCNYPGCNKAYGTLNHLNAHVSMQKHGPKRLPAGMYSLLSWLPVIYFANS